MDIRLIDYESTTAAGINMAALRSAINTQTSGLRRNDYLGSSLETWIGRVPEIDDIELGIWQSRNNALAALGLQQGNITQTLNNLKQRFSAGRLGIIMGTSTSSIDRTEQAYRELTEDQQLTTQYQQPQVHNPHSLGLFVAHYMGITGPTITINTACSSSAKIFATGARWLSTGVVDAVLVGGVDTLCLSVLHGFASLQVMSPDKCCPFDQQRNGLNLGEAAAYAILMRANDNEQDTGVRLVGYGESSDAHHMSHPHPQGLGAELAMKQAINTAQLFPEQIDYINLHGTATRANDEIEAKVVSKLFPKSTQCSSTKGWFGHTLGAAGITEALIAVDAAKQDLIPGSMHLKQLDENMGFSIQADNQQRKSQYVMSNSFGFGGNNCSLIFGKVDAV